MKQTNKTTFSRKGRRVKSLIKDTIIYLILFTILVIFVILPEFYGKPIAEWSDGMMRVVGDLSIYLLGMIGLFEFGFLAFQTVQNGERRKFAVEFMECGIDFFPELFCLFHGKYSFSVGFGGTLAAGEQFVNGHAEKFAQAEQNGAFRFCGTVFPFGDRLVRYTDERAELCLRQTLPFS